MRRSEVASVVAVVMIGGACADDRLARTPASRVSSRDACSLVTVIARGAPTKGTNGLAIDPEGHLRIASLIGNEILAMDRESGLILDRLTLEQAPGPDDIAIGPDGSIYWTSLITGYVGRLSPSHEYSTQYVAPGVNPITFSASGRLFVGLDFLGDGLYELDPQLQAPPRAIVANQPGHYPLGFINGFDFGADGRLYGPLWLLEMVVSIDVDSCTNSTSPWTECDIQPVATGLGIPSAAKFDANGMLHVTNADGQVFRIIAPFEAELVAQLQYAIDNLTFDDRNRLFVSGYEDGSIARIEGGAVTYLSPGGMIIPGGIASIANDHGSDSLFVADGMSLRELSPASGNQIGFVRSTLTDTVFQPPVSASADGSDLVLASAFASTVQVFSTESRQVVESYAPVTPPFNAVRFEGDLVAATFGTDGRVVRIPSGDTVLGAPYVVYPLGLATGGGALFVSDWYTGVVWRVDAGQATPTLVASGLVDPEGLALDDHAGLLVVESGAGRLSRIDLQTGQVMTIAEGLSLGLRGAVPAFPPHGTINGVSVAASGDIYVTGDRGENVVYRIRPKPHGANCRDATR